MKALSMSTSCTIVLSVLLSLLEHQLRMTFLATSSRSAMFALGFVLKRHRPTTSTTTTSFSKIATFASIGRTKSLQMAAPGVICATHDAIREALANPKTTILDVRGVDEIVASGYLETNGLQYIHSQCTPTDAPMLSIAAEDLIRDKTAPVVVYCAKGFRATKAKEVLESKGYTNVLNAGGISDLDFLKE